MGVQMPPSLDAISDVTVAEVMRPGIITCPPSANLRMLAATMVTHSIHAVFVTSLADTPRIVDDLELIKAALGATGNLHAAELASEPAATVSTEASLGEAVEIMVVRSVWHVVAVDPGSGTPAGVISSLDLAAVTAGVQPRVARMSVPGPARPSPSAHRLTDALVVDVMHPGVTACPADAPLWMVGLVMAEHRVHCVAVAGITSPQDPHLLWGLVEDTHFVSALHRRALAEPVAKVAESAPVAVNEGESLDRAARLMVEHDTRHLVVVGSAGVPSGIVSTLDVATILAQETPGTGI